MRRFEDAEGKAWEVVVGRSSWGAFHALFVPIGGGAGGEAGGVRQAHLASVSQAEAERELAALPAEDLARLLDRSSPRDP